MDVQQFLNAPKSMIIAPAGYGKTHTISEALLSYNGQKRVLVLTHTHAGIASLKEKFSQNNIPLGKYHLDTICSFALNLTKVFHLNKDEIPTDQEVSVLFDFAIEKAKLILCASPIRQLMHSRYEHLIVDEYQDCSVDQHEMIMILSETLKTHLLGDPLQGIFNFGTHKIVDFADSKLIQFMQNSQTLETPWRWKNAGNVSLGNDLAMIREKLISEEDVDLKDYKSIIWIKGSESDYARQNSNVKNNIFRELNNGAVIIHPNATSVEPRKAVARLFKQLQLIEPIDSKDYYDICLRIDKNIGPQLVQDLVTVMRKICNKTCINKWFRENGTIISKRLQSDQIIQQRLESARNKLVEEKNHTNIISFIDVIDSLSDIVVYRKEFHKDLKNILLYAERLHITASEALARNRNMLRHKGRKIMEKSIGTTLLTKGLEFKNVVVLNAQQFKNPRDFYVAITRCSKRLVVISNSNILHPYSS